MLKRPDMIVCVVRDSGCLAIFLVPRLISALSRSRGTYWFAFDDEFITDITGLSICSAESRRPIDHRRPPTSTHWMPWQAHFASFDNARREPSHEAAMPRGRIRTACIRICHARDPAVLASGGLLERIDVTLLPLPDKLGHWCNWHGSASYRPLLLHLSGLPVA